MYNISIFTILLTLVLNGVPFNYALRDDIKPLLAGGNDAPIYVQFVALLNITYDTNVRDYCSATVITNQFALASGDCFNGGFETLELYTGYGQLNDTDSIQRRTIPSANVTYNELGTLALLYIAVPLDVTTLQLPVICNPFEDYNSDRVAVFSFGKTNDGITSKPSNRLQSLLAKISRKCSRPEHYELCAYTMNEHAGLCSGDQGSPVIVAQNEHLDLLGLVYSVQNSCISRYIYIIDLRYQFFWIDSEIFRITEKHYIHVP